MRISSIVWVAAALGAACQSGSPGAGQVVRPEVAAGAAASLPAARVSYGAPLAIDDAPPIALTASDGTGLALTHLDARAVVDGPLAFTELHLTFENPQDRVLEGRFAITLPERAAISRFAMEIDGRWMEAEVVERMAARRAYEDFLHRRQDPALLEKEAGNEFRARVFPIPARGVKKLIVAYSQELADPDQAYVLPLRGLPRIGAVTARIQVAKVDGAGPSERGCERADSVCDDKAGRTSVRPVLRWDEVALDQRDWQPDRDLVAPGSAATHALGAPGVVAMRVVPELGAAADPVGAATILVDTSASRAAGFPAYARAVEAMIVALGDAPVIVAAFDQGVAELWRGRARDAAGAVEPALRGRMPLGASDLAGALAWAKANPAARVIVVTDGVSTAGELDAAALGAQVGALAGVERLDVVLAGGIRDRAVAESLTRGRLARDGAVLDLDDGAPEVARRLGLATRSGIEVKVDGATAVWPVRLDGVQPGDAAMVYAWFDGDRAPASVAVRLGGDRRRIAVEPAAAPLVARAAAQARIARLEAALGGAPDAAARAKAIDEIVAISMRERVLSEHTALLVLETEDDYRRFGIDRTALAGILVVGAAGVEVQRRDDVVLMAADPAPARDADRKDEDKAKGKDGEALKKADTNAAEGGEIVDRLGAPEETIVTEAPGASPPPPDARPEPRLAVERAAEETDDDEAEAPRRRVAARPQVRSGRAEVAGGVEGGVVGGAAGGVAVEREAKPTGPPPYTGRMATVMDLIAAGRRDAALDEALAWRGEEPADVMALVALGEALEADARPELAARAYGSIIDLFPARADLRRFAGERLDRLAATDDGARALAIDTYRRAALQRPDHLTGHRLLAFALVRAGKHADAFAALEHGLAQGYPAGRFAGGERILREELGLIGAAWRRVEPKRAAEIDRRLRAAGAALPREASLRFVLTWETDANDVDFHIRDARGGHAFYSSPRLPSGGELYADVTTGYGPECFTIPGAASAAPYELSIHYYSRGPMGYGMGTLEIIRHDGTGNLAFEQRPFVVMNDGAYVDLGRVE